MEHIFQQWIILMLTKICKLSSDELFFGNTCCEFVHLITDKTEFSTPWLRLAEELMIDQFMILYHLACCF